MNIVVLNGSPKGETSVTMQYVKYLQKVNTEHTFLYRHVAHEIRKLERNTEALQNVIDNVRGADVVLWAFPLYVCVVHADFMRFIELITEHGHAGAFAGKPAAALSTSIHFFDNTAHAYLHAICDDLGMNYCGFFSANMDDLLDEKNRKNLEFFGTDFLTQAQKNLPPMRRYPPVTPNSWEYVPGAAATKLKAGGKKVLVITQGTAGNPNLQHMVARLTDRLEQADIVDLDAIRILGGCRGCISCGLSNECIYGDKDDIAQLYNQRVRQADIIVIAAPLQGRFLSARFKTFMDRRFLNTHQPQMVGKQLAYLISGPLGHNANVAEVLQAMAELDQANLAAILTDEGQSSAALDARLDALAEQLLTLATKGYCRPGTFLGVAGQKIFRDDIYGRLRFPFLADHKYYKTHGMYDFPQKQRKAILQSILLSWLTHVRQIRQQITSDMPKHMIAPYQRYL